MSNQVVMARALYDFTGDPAVRQLTFKKNDVIKVTHQYENGWWAGEINGKIGYLPSTYIKLEGAASPAPPSNAPPSNAPPAGGAAKSALATSGGMRPTPPAKPAPERTPFGMTSVTSNNPAPVQQPVKPSPPSTGPPSRPAPSPVPVHQQSSPSTISKPPPVVSKPPPTVSKPPPTAKPPPPGAGKPLPPVKPQPALPSSQPPQQPQNRNVPTLGKSAGWSSAAPGSEVNESDFNELDSLIKSLQDEVLDLKKLL